MTGSTVRIRGFDLLLTSWNGAIAQFGKRVLWQARVVVRSVWLHRTQPPTVAHSPLAVPWLVLKQGFRFRRMGSFLCARNAGYLTS